MALFVGACFVLPKKKKKQNVVTPFCWEVLCVVLLRLYNKVCHSVVLCLFENLPSSEPP